MAIGIDEYLRLMKFPAAWQELGMYPAELAKLQTDGYEPGHEDGSEHDRNGAFHWWLKRGPTKHQLAALLQLAALDPDPAVGQDVNAHIRLAAAFDDELGALSNRLFGNP